MQKIYNLDKWQLLPGGQQLEFPGERPRTVRIEVNAPRKTALDVTYEDGECQFLALVEGRDVIEFSAPASFGLVSESDVYIYTAEGEDISIRLDAPVSYTKVVERRRRNPELERMMQLMNRNMEERIAIATREIERRHAAASERGVSRSLPAGTAFSKPETVPAHDAGPKADDEQGSNGSIREEAGGSGGGRGKQPPAANP